MASALAALSQADVPLGLWPLLEDEEGYWPSEDNASAFLGRVRDALGFAERAGAKVRTIAIDLEPPLEVMRALSGDSKRAQASVLFQGLRGAPGRRVLRRAANRDFGLLSRSLRQQGYETIAAVVPPVVFDLYSGSRAMQAILRTPVSDPGWSVISPMMYTTIMAQLLSEEVAKALLLGLGQSLRERLGPSRSAMSLGLVTSGKLDDEPVYPSPFALLEDVQLARAAGINDLALFALEGVLHRDSPERWLLPFTQASAAPAPWRGSMMSALVRTAMNTAGWAMRLSGDRSPPMLP